MFAKRYLLAGLLLALFSSSCSSRLSVDTIYIASPVDVEQPVPAFSHVVIIRRGGDSTYSEMQDQGERSILPGTFDIDKVFQQLLGELVNTWDSKEHSSEPVGKVMIWFNDETSGTYFIYDEAYVQELYDWAKENVDE